MKENSELIIREVYAYNFVSEMKIITSLLHQYPYIGMDTEFPGTLFSNSLTSYQAIKENTDSLKLIQVGITLSDENGNFPLDCGVWQFNLSFSLKNDKYSKESINLLVNSGINFAYLESHGIPQEVFGEYLLSSGLVLNDELTWICFHGIYDFAYLLKIVTNLPLPFNEKLFFNDLKLYFPTFYDIRFLIRHNELLKGSLNRLSQELNISHAVVFEGNVVDLHERIKGASMFVLSSNYEGISNSMAEALGLGLAVIATDCPIGGSRMYITSGVNGLLIPVDDSNALYEAIKSLIEDENLRKSLSQNAEKVREQWKMNSKDKILCLSFV
jgi:CCR4-NOT transcription complex subunit 7/8